MTETMTESVAAREQASDEEVIEKLPPEVGILLIVVGVGGLLLPGPIGTPFLLLGGLTLFPSAFRGLDRGMRRRFPKAHRDGMRHVRRFLHDLERRYPSTR